MKNCFINRNVIRMMLLVLMFGLGQSVRAEEKSWAHSYQLEAEGKYEQAAALLEPFMLVGEDREFANMRYGWLLYLSGKNKPSVKSYQKALDLNPNSIEARLGITLPYLAEGQCDKVMQVTQQVIDVSPKNYLAHYRQMTCEQIQQSWRKLETHAEMMVSYYPSEVDLWILLARAKANLNKNSEARSAYRKVLVLYPGQLEALGFLK